MPNSYYIGQMQDQIEGGRVAYEPHHLQQTTENLHSLQDNILDIQYHSQYK